MTDDVVTRARAALVGVTEGWPDNVWCYCHAAGSLDAFETEFDCVEEAQEFGREMTVRRFVRASLVVPIVSELADEIERLRAMTPAASDVLAERLRQQAVEGWTPAHDDQWDSGEMSRAASCYVMQAALDDIGTPSLSSATKHMIREFWPWSARWWKPTDRRRDLVKAGALILAEIERLDRRDAALQAQMDGKGE